MKERKTKHVRIRLSESQVKNIRNYILEFPNEFKNQSELIRKSIDDTTCRKKNIITKSIGKSKIDDL